MRAARRVLARMTPLAQCGHDVDMTSDRTVRLAIRVGVGCFAASTLLGAASVRSSPAAGGWGEWAVVHAVLLPSLALGLVIAVRRPGSPTAAALVWVAASVALVSAVEAWGSTVGTADALPGARALGILRAGFWVWQLAGLVALCLVFPDGPLDEPLWKRTPYLALGSALLVNAAVSLDRSNFRTTGTGPIPGSPPIAIPTAVRPVELTTAFALVAASLGCCCWCLIRRYRRGDETTRRQLRWLMLGAEGVTVLLVCGWIAETAGLSQAAAYVGFMLALTVGLPLAVAIAVIRHDLLDIDRLLSGSVSWVLTTCAAAAIFGAVAVGAAELLNATTAARVFGAAFLTALCVAPAHRWLVRVVGRTIEPDRFRMETRLRAFVEEMRDGTVEPEAVEDVLRDVLDDPGLRLVLRHPAGSHELVDVRGSPVGEPGGNDAIALRVDAVDVGALVLSRPSARRLRLAREGVAEVRLPIEVSRLRLQLRAALDEARSSRARLAQSVAAERRRLERDLHDGAQQQIISAGMQVRAVQASLDPGVPAHAALDGVVESLELIVDELRTLAHGVRPRRLDDGLPAALRTLTSDLGAAVDLRAEDVDVSDVVATTLYFVVAECLVNALKHSQAGRLQVWLGNQADRVVAEIVDDGVGGAADGFGLSSIRDRVSAVGGELFIDSPAGGGTRVRVEI